MTSGKVELAKTVSKNIGALGVEVGDLLSRLPRYNTKALATSATDELLDAQVALLRARDALMKLERVAALPRQVFAADDLEIIPPTRQH